MSALRSTVRALIAASAVVGFSGSLAFAGDEPVHTPAAKVYAENVGLMMPHQPANVSPQEKDVWEIAALSSSPTACGLGCRTGFFGYH
jgi:hypothetical protein